MTLRDETDEPRDAHLLAALRHAPDHDAVPPAAVTAHILAQARAALRDDRPSWRERVALWWHRPALGAAFGTIASAALVALLWSTREPPVSVPEAAEPPPAAPAPVATGAVGTQRRQPESAPAAAPAAPAAAASPSKPALRARAEPPAAVVPEPASAPKAAARSTTLPTPPAAAPAAAPAPAPPPLPEVNGARDAAERSDARAAGPRRADNAVGGLGSMLEQRAMKADAAAPALLQLVDDWLVLPQTVTSVAWQTQRPVPHGAAQQRWWREVREATQGRWRPAEAAPSTGPWLALSVGGIERARFWLETSELLMADAGGRTWRVVVDAEQRRRWSEAAAGW